MDIRYSVGPDELKTLSTDELRKKYLIEEIFVDNGNFCFIHFLFFLPIQFH